MSDAELLRQYSSSRSEDAFRALIDQYVNMVYSSCWRQLRDRHLAEDATQAVFVLLSQKAGAMRHANLAGWLLTTARYACAKIRKMEMRRRRRETAVAMENSRDGEVQNDELLAMLDEGLSRLRAKDREAVALRYLQGQPFSQVGQALGISEEAARKRVDRCVEKLRKYFARKGIVTAAGALPAILDQQARAAGLSVEARASLTQGILHACHGAGAAPAIAALAKGTNIMMQLTRIKIVSAALLLGVGIAGAGWWSAMRVMADGTNAQPATQPTAEQPQSDDAKYQACRQVLTSIIDAHERGDAEAYKSCLYLSDSADPRLVGSLPVLIDFDLALYRLEKAAFNRFGAQAFGVNFYSGNTNMVFLAEDLLARIERKDMRIVGDTVALTPAPPFPRGGPWHRGSLYFVNVDGVWKLDVVRSLRFTLRFHRRVPVQGETDEQTLAAAEKSLIGSLNAICQDIEAGKISDAGQLQKRLDGAIIAVAMVFSDFDADVDPR